MPDIWMPCNYRCGSLPACGLIIDAHWIAQGKNLLHQQRNVNCYKFTTCIIELVALLFLVSVGMLVTSINERKIDQLTPLKFCSAWYSQAEISPSHTKKNKNWVCRSIESKLLEMTWVKNGKGYVLTIILEEDRPCLKMYLLASYRLAYFYNSSKQAIAIAMCCCLDGSLGRPVS